MLDGGRRCAVARRETGEDKSFLIVVLAEYLVVAQIVAVADAEPTTFIVVPLTSTNYRYDLTALYSSPAVYSQCRSNE